MGEVYSKGRRSNGIHYCGGVVSGENGVVVSIGGSAFGDIDIGCVVRPVTGKVVDFPCIMVVRKMCSGCVRLITIFMEERFE